MPLTEEMRDAAKRSRGGPGGASPTPKIGEFIFAGTDYPRTYDGFIGQVDAVAQLKTAVASAKKRGTRLGHILLSSGAHGIGKTTLAQIIAYDMGTGYVEVSGSLNGDEFLRVIGNMADGDILFWDEFHLAVQGNRTKADWLLPMLTDHKISTKRGYVDAPDITVIAATTEAGKLNYTLTSRFTIKPHLEYYTVEEAIQIVELTAVRVKVRISNKETLRVIAEASNGNPRDIRSILEQVRDIAVTEDGKVNLDKALRWAGLTRDGLSRDQQAYMICLLSSPDMTAGEKTLQAVLGEPGPMKHIENPLMQRSFVVTTGRGRTLTDSGVERAKLLVGTEEAA
jgi:Holliday junction DNA helicase RuvB